MTTAGRHRRDLSPKRPPSLLLVEYPGGESRSGDYWGAAIVPPRGRSAGIGPFGSRRTFALAVAATLAGVVAAAVLGTSALRLSGTTGTTGGGRGAAPSLPLTASAQPPTASASPSAPASARPRHAHARRTTRPAAEVPSPGTTSPPRTTLPLSAPRASPSTPRSTPAIVVRYLVDSQEPGGFEGQVQVINNGLQPIAEWQIVLALQGDTVTSFQNASGYFSNGILLLQPAGAGQLVPADGGTLNVFFAAEGTQTMPQACAFNGIACG
jgi:hypothetical protein